MIEIDLFVWMAQFCKQSSALVVFNLLKLDHSTLTTLNLIIHTEILMLITPFGLIPTKI